MIWMLLVLVLLFETGLYCQYIKAFKQLTVEKTVDYFPDWSPDGKYIAYAGRGDVSHIYKIPASGGKAVQLTKVPSGHPRWSPDGRYIAFDNYDTKQVQVISSTGGTPIRIVPEKIPGKRKRHPCWSPDGKAIALYADGDIYTVNPSSGVFERIFHKEGFSARPCVWSSGIGGLLLDVWSAGNTESDIWFISHDGKTTRWLTDFPGKETTPDLSPDGSMIVFASNLSGSMDIWVMPAAGGAELQLTKDAARDMSPRWSPNGKNIAFASERSGNRDIWIMELDVSAIKMKLGIAKTKQK